MADKREYSAGSFALEIEGQFAGWLSSVEGGVAYGVVVEKASATGPTDKSISEVKYDDITFTCGVLNAVLADWLVPFFKGQAPTHAGAVVFGNFQGQSIRRLEWDKAHIVAVTLPGLDGSSHNVVKLTISIRPEVTRSSKASGAMPANLGKGSLAPPWLASNYSVVIPGVDCSRVGSVEALTISQDFVPPTSGRGVPKPGPLQVADLVLTLSESHAADFVTWSDDFIVRGNNNNAFEKSATIRYLARDFKSEIFSVNLKSVGIHRLDPKLQSANVDKIARLEASMYCEQAELVLPAQEVAPPATIPTEDGPNNLREFLGVRLGAEEVTRRLQDTRSQPAVTSEADRQRQLGVDLGIAWAERRASLAELEELGTVDDNWSSIALPPGHSLSEVLEATGVVPLQYDGRLELSRDSMVEGILAGILKVMSEVSGDITRNMK